MDNSPKTIRQQLMTKLIMTQNHPANCNQDIVTFSAFLNDKELFFHVERYLNQATEWNRKHNRASA